MLKPKSAGALQQQFQQALALHALQRPAEALMSCDRAIALDRVWPLASALHG